MNNERKWRRARDAEVTRVFNRFAGKIVDPADPRDPVLEEMRREAAMHYSMLSLVPPGAARCEPGKISRINAELQDAGGGKWRIGNRFFRG